MDPPTYPFEETSFMDGPLAEFSEFSLVVITNLLEDNLSYNYAKGQMIS